MNKIAVRTVELNKGHVDVYEKNGITLYAYQTHDLIDDEVFVLARSGRGVVIELPCFHDNIRELTAFLAPGGASQVEAKLVAYHAAGRGLPAGGSGLWHGLLRRLQHHGRRRSAGGQLSKTRFGEQL